RSMIQPLKSSPLRGLVIPANDRDKALLVSIMQVRRYMYGGLSNRDITDYISGRKKYLQFKGVMSFYPLLNDESQLRNLDGWLVSMIYRCIQLRSKLLILHGFNRLHSFPFNVAHKNLVEQLGRRRIKGKRLLEIPSFTLIYRALQRGLREAGIEKVMHPQSLKYEYKGI
ncbi:hypothetical protein, partial [Pseudomonas sp. MPBD4-3]